MELHTKGGRGGGGGAVKKMELRTKGRGIINKTKPQIHTQLPRTRLVCVCILMNNQCWYGLYTQTYSDTHSDNDLRRGTIYMNIATYLSL